MAIVFSRIFYLSLLSTATRIPPAGCGRCSWKMRPMWYRSKAAEEKMEPVQEKLGVLISLLCGQLQPMDGLPLILGDVLAQQICFA